MGKDPNISYIGYVSTWAFIERFHIFVLVDSPAALSIKMTWQKIKADVGDAAHGKISCFQETLITRDEVRHQKET